MNKKITIAIDAMGGENSPNKTIEGINIFLKNHKDANDFEINLFGDKKKIQDEINNFKIIDKRINIIHTSKIISDEETPLTAIKNSKETSMWNCINAQINGSADISLSA